MGQKKGRDDRDGFRTETPGLERALDHSINQMEYGEGVHKSYKTAGTEIQMEEI